MAILFDLYMPEVDGLSALGHFRRKYPSIPVIVITGSDDETDEKTASNLGAIGYFKKPFPASSIHNTVRELLEKLHSPKS